MLYMSCVDWLPRFAAKVLGLDSPTSPMLVASLSVGFWMLRFSGQGFVTMAGRNMVAKWWRYHRGKVLPISGIGVSVCFSLSPLVFYELIQATDWRVAWRILGLCSGIGVALYAWFVYRGNPEECDLSIDAGIAPRQKQRDDPEFTVVKEFTRDEAIQSFSFFAALMATGTGLTAFALMTRIDGWMIPMMIAGMSINSGSFGPMTGAFVPRYFGIKHIGAISGVMMSTMVIASATGPLLFSVVRDFTGSYRNAFGSTFAVAVILVMASFWANNPQRKIKMQLDEEKTGSLR